MISVKELLEKRSAYSILKQHDSWIEEIINSETQEETYFISIDSFVSTAEPKQKKEFLKKYSIAGIYDLGSPFTNTGIRMDIIHAISKPVEVIKFSIYDAVTFDRRKYKSNTGDGFSIPTEYYGQYEKYLSAIENWINGGTMPEDINNGEAEFCCIPIKSIEDGKLYPRYYSKKAIELRALLQKEETVKLSDVADIMPIPRVDMGSSETVKLLSIKDLQYPINVDNLSEGKPTNIILQKGDIVIPTTGTARPFLYNLEDDIRVYAAPRTAVIKCNKILPEYLYLYLISDTAKSILDSISIGATVQHISLRDLTNLPIPLPTLEEQKYINDFNILSSIETRTYGNQTDRFLAYYNKLTEIQNKEKQADHIEDILNIELASKIKVHNEEQLRTFLTDDLRELNACYRAKAYKATLILAGSILEAVLIDWLSEIKGVDYFTNDYMITDRNGRSKRADLIDYINEIKYIERPRWVDEATKAHEIRKKRNLVHAKLCLSQSIEIDDETCQMVIGYLRDVLKTRGVETE